MCLVRVQAYLSSAFPLTAAAATKVSSVTERGVTQTGFDAAK